MKREQWGSRGGFIIAAVGSAIGLGNIWRFPYIAYENGGGAFLIPYLFAMMTAGIPFMILEFSMGQKYRSSAPKTLSKIHSNFEWLGWFQVSVAFTVSIYYVAIVGWAISYFFLSFEQGWGEDTNSFFFTSYLGLGDHSPTKLGTIQWKIAAAMAVAWMINYVAVIGGVKAGIERLSKVMMPILFLMVTILILRMLFLPGAVSGIDYMFRPDFSKIWDAKVWASAYGQIFFTLSIGYSVMLAYSSYLPEKSDISNNAFMTVLINCGFSIFAGIMVFSVLGYMAQQQGKNITDVVSSGMGLAFITLPKAINLLPAPYILGPVLFFALVIAGLSSLVSTLESVVSALMDKFHWSRKLSANIVFGLGFILAMTFATNGGFRLIDLVDHFINNIGIVIGGLVEIILMTWFAKVSDVRSRVNSISDFSIGIWFDICLRFVTPVILAVLVMTKIHTLKTEGYGGYDLSLGWIIIFALWVMAGFGEACRRKGSKE